MGKGGGGRGGVLTDRRRLLSMRRGTTRGLPIDRPFIGDRGGCTLPQPTPAHPQTDASRSRATADDNSLGPLISEPTRTFACKYLAPLMMKGLLLTVHVRNIVFKMKGAKIDSAANAAPALEQTYM